MRVLVTGAAGMLGNALVPALVARGHSVVTTDINLAAPRPWGADGPTLGHLDVRDHDEIARAFVEVRPQLVLHLAALTSLEQCELEYEDAFHTNTLGTKFVALECQRHDVPLAYISTAGVFDGTKDGPYTEFDRPNPINAYGHSKYEGERYVQQLLNRFFIVRAGWMVGGGVKDHKFVARIMGQLAAGATTIYAVGDKLGTPTYTPDFSRCFLNLVRSGSYGLYHMACEGSGSRYDVARQILDALGRTDVDLVEVESSFFAKEFFAARPRSEIMVNMVLRLQRMNTMRPWPVAIQDYLNREFLDVRVMGNGPLQPAATGAVGASNGSA